MIYKNGILCLILGLLISLPCWGQVFFDDFESGLGSWTGTWGLTEESSHSPTHSLTDSPGSL